MKKSICSALAVFLLSLGAFGFLASYGVYQKAIAVGASISWPVVDKWLTITGLVSFIVVLVGAFWLKRLTDSGRLTDRQTSQKTQDSVDDEYLSQDQSV